MFTKKIEIRRNKCIISKSGKIKAEYIKHINTELIKTYSNRRLDSDTGWKITGAGNKS